MDDQSALGLRACRICLGTESKLYDVNKNGLAQSLMEFTSPMTFNILGMPQYVCVFCRAHLKQATAFRNKCTATQTLLHECLLMQPLTLDFIQKIDRTKIQPPFTITKLPSHAYIEEITLTDTGFKKEVDSEAVGHRRDVKSENVNEENYVNLSPEDDDDDRFDTEIGDFSVDVKLEAIKNEDSADIFDVDLETNKKPSKRKQKQVSTRPKRSKKSEFNKYLKDQYVDDTKTDNNDEYGDETKKSDDTINPLDSDDEFLVQLKSKTKDDKEIIKDINESSTKDKYKDKPKQKRKESKITRLSRNVTKRKTNKQEEKQSQQDVKRKEDMDKFAEEFNFEVIALTLKDQLQEMEARKTTSNYKDSPFKCELCYRGFRSDDTYNSHMLSHDPSTGSEVCEICRSRFPNRRKLTKHMRSHRTKFICKTCTAVFRCSTEAKMHYQGHGGREFICEHCGKIFTRYRSRVEHIRIYHGTTRCDVCYKGVSNAYAVIAHKAKAHREVFICDVCKVNFNKKAALNKHIASLHAASCTTVRPCSACGENFPSESQLQDHIVTWHPHVRPDSSKRGRRVGSKGKKRCCPCGHKGEYQDPKLYPALQANTDANGHMYLHDDGYHKIMAEDDHAPKPISGPYGTFTPLNQCCCPCKTIFKKREKKDEDENAKKKTYMCEVCALDKFPSAAALRNHQRIHTGEKPYQCPLCPKRFRGQEYLTYHLNVHTGERPYKCPNCPKAFKNPTANHRHQLVHNKKRPHRCEICDKTFQTSTYLKIHVRTVHMKIPMPPRVRNRKKIVK